MPEFGAIYKTSKLGTSGHYHLVYKAKDGSLLSTEAKGHVHEDIGGMLAPAGRDNHTHDIIEEPIFGDESTEEETETEIISDIIELFKAGRELEMEYRTKGRESEDMVGHKQWEDSDKDKIEGEDRPALTINEMEPKLDLLSGYQRQNRLDITYKPTEGGDQLTADIFTALAKNITEQSNFSFEETEAFEDQIITGRGNINLDVSYDKNIEGDILLERWPWDEIVYGPHNKKDASDAEYQVKHKWYSLAKLRETWPDKAKDIKNAVQNLSELSGDYEEGDVIQNNPGERYQRDNGIVLSALKDPELVDIIDKKYRVLECWRKSYKKVTVLFNISEDVYISLADWNKKDINAAKTLPGFSSIDRVVTSIRVTRIAGGVLLDDEISELFESSFPAIPIYAKKRGERIWGKAEAMKDLQREGNKRRSQLADIINKVAVYGWFYDHSTFSSPEDVDTFKKQAAKPGFLLEVENTNNVPVRQDGVKFPSEIVNYDLQNSQKMREITNINLELLGQDQRVLSGVAIAEKKRQGLIGNEFLFDNLSLSKRAIGRELVRLIQKVISPKRAMRILNHMDENGEPIRLAKRPFTEVPPDAIMMALQSADVEKYDVVVSENLNTATNRLATFAIWADLAGKGLPVPPLFLAELSDAPHKDKLIQGIEQLQQQQQQEDERTRQTEIVKTQIAQQGKNNNNQ